MGPRPLTFPQNPIPKPLQGRQAVQKDGFGSF